MTRITSIFKVVRNRWYLFAVAAVIVGILLYRFVIAPPTSKKNGTYLVKRETLKETLSLSGKIAASEDATLRFQTSGRLVWVGVSEGDYVKKYQSLASLDQREVQKTLEKYLAAYMKSRWDYDQATQTTYQNTIFTDTIKRTVDKLQFDLNSSVLDVEIKNLAVEFANLWTPIEGLVVKVDAPKAGVNITPTTAEFEIINPKSVYFSATADQVDVVRLAASQSGEITLDAYLDKTINSQIREISFIPQTDETGTVYEVKMTMPVDNSSYQYRLGMTGDVSFTLAEKPNLLAVPSKYIKSEAGKKYVLKKNKEKVFVETGQEFDNLVEIKSGLSENDVIFQ